MYYAFNLPHDIFLKLRNTLLVLLKKTIVYNCKKRGEDC